MKWHPIVVSSMAALVLPLCTAAHADVITHGTTTINMEFVTVGNAGNAADTQWYGAVGAVGYDYRIGKYEVTAEQWAAVIAADPSVGNSGNWSDSQPTAGTSWYEAAKFCNWLTTGSANSGVYNTSTWAIMDHQTAAATFGTAYFIPTEDEWYKAAYYDPNKGGAGVGGYWDYPTKHDYPPDGPDGIDSSTDTEFDAVFNEGYNQGHPNSVDNAGVASAYGTIGQGGNVWEWNEETDIGSSRVLRGGYWYSVDYVLGASHRSSTHPSTESPGIGFRVASSAAVPEPGGIVMCLGLAVSGLLLIRRRR